MVAGRHAVLFGRATTNRYNRVVLENPDYELLDDEDTDRIHTGRIVPVYRKVGELTGRALRSLMFRALFELDPDSLGELVPGDVAERHGLLPRLVALRGAHFPDRASDLEKLGRRQTAAQQSLAFEEIFLLQLALALRRHGVKQETRGIAYEVPDALRTRLAKLLPFRLTPAQKRVLREIGSDLRSTHPMNRLLQGDVGSGKTVVALLTLLVAVENGYQAALMAPTEILAEQHFRTITRFLAGGEQEIPCQLLTGSLRAPVRRRALEDIRSGRAKLVVGTHALFESGVDFKRLGLAVVDEQHRFGVLQRAELARKGTRPDVLVMTATPIPRSLALTLYGDLDLSVIDELPPGRTPIKTVVRTDADRDRVYQGLRREIEKGRQVYIVVPLVEETEKSDLKAAVAFAEELREGVFLGLEVGMIHGRMKGADKDRVMQEFSAGRCNALVATTVIEVGVDVPNATVMVVEHAERFGLSQLHQLRGRVGRGSERSFCALMVGGAGHGREAHERLAIMEATSDGFRIAEKDLELRGPGAVFGTQQHGLSDLQFLALVLQAPALLEGARAEAQRRVAGDAATREASRATLAALGGRWKRRLDLAHVG